jgi:hypothetical protein
MVGAAVEANGPSGGDDDGYGSLRFPAFDIGVEDEAAVRGVADARLQAVHAKGDAAVQGQTSAGEAEQAELAGLAKLRQSDLVSSPR